MTSSWRLDPERTKERLRQSDWIPRYATAFECIPGMPEMFMIHIRLTNLRRFHQKAIQHDLKLMCRAPWRVFAFTLQDGEDRKYSEEDFLRWLVLNESVEEDALSMKPADFVVAHPTWTTHDGHEYTTDFWPVIFGSDLLSTKISFSTHGEFLVTDVSDKNRTLNFVAGREFQKLPVNGTDNLGLVTKGDPYHKHWIGNYKLELDANSATFDTDSAALAACLYKLAHQGMYFPYHTKWLPEEAGYGAIALNNYCQLRAFNVFHNSVPHKFASDFDSTVKLNELRYQDLDFCPYLHTQNFHMLNSCLSKLHKPCANGRKVVGDTKVVPVSVNQALSTLQTVLQSMAQAYHTRPSSLYSKDYKSIVEDIESELESCSAIKALLAWQTNAVFHQSEGFLQLKDLVTATEKLIYSMMNATLVTKQVGTTWVQTLGNLEVTTTITDEAKTTGLYREDFATAKRPLYVEQAKVMDKIQRQAKDQQEQMKHPKLPLYLIIIIMFLAVLFCLGAAKGIMVLAARYKGGTSS